MISAVVFCMLTRAKIVSDSKKLLEKIPPRINREIVYIYAPRHFKKKDQVFSDCT